MYEFSSISVSSYDAASLADKLTERSSEGWDVVAIVPAGTNVTAYLRRATLGAGGLAAGDAAAAGAVDVAAFDTDSVEDGVEERIEEGATADAASPVEEPAGWATEPEPSQPEAAVVEPALPERQAETAAVAATAAPAETAVQQQASSATAAPAGWYADPSTRYELRYWDGSQWTEHVSRAGQQYTDPPVA